MTTNAKPQLTILSNTTADLNQEIIIRAQLAKKKGIEFTIKEFLEELNLKHLTSEHKKQLAELCGITVANVNNALRSHASEKKLIEQLGKVPCDEYEFVDLQLKNWNTTMSYNGIYKIDTPYIAILSDEVEARTIDNDTFNNLSESEQLAIKAADPKIITGDILQKKLIKSNVNLRTNYSERNLELAFDYWTENAKNKIVSGMIRNITITTFDPLVAEDEWSKFIVTITSDNIAETKAVLKHFIWQVKRKIINDDKYPVTDHIMPVLHGGQGFGKSTLLKKLTEPVADFTASTDFKSITDERNHEIWSKFVLIFDEMADSARENIEDIKRKITETSFSSRVMKTNRTTQLINKSTFIGASNKDLSRLIIDDTGMRRFFQINYKKPENNEWEILSNIDYYLLWNSVDYKSNSPLHDTTELFMSIRNIQNEKRHVGLVENFLLDRNYVNGVEKIYATNLYEEFKEFELTQKPRNEQSNSAFGKELMDVYPRISGLVITKKRGKKGIYYLISKKIELNF